tara:strand:- start:12000 stop:12266 length:267 start_codon:yes stop_codon:yes gene_type:complete
MKYHEQGGWARMDFDVAVAAELNERISEQHEEAKARGRSRAGMGSRGSSSAVTRRNKRREERANATMTGGDLGKLLQDTFNNKKTGGE